MNEPIQRAESAPTHAAPLAPSVHEARLEDLCAHARGNLSDAALRRWVRDNAATIRWMLRERRFKEEHIVPILWAFRQLSSLAVFEGDPVAWYAKYAGRPKAEISKCQEIALWLCDPSEFALPPDQAALPEAARARAARQGQVGLRQLFLDAHASIAVMKTCKEQCNYLDKNIKWKTPEVIAHVLAKTGPDPEVGKVFQHLQETVKNYNQAFRGGRKRKRQTHARFSKPDMLGHQVITIFTHADLAALAQRALTKFAHEHPTLCNPSAPKDVRLGEAFMWMCRNYLGQDPADAHGETRGNGLEYSVNVTLTASEYAAVLEEGRPGVKRFLSEHGGKVSWAEVASSALSPVQMLTIIGEHGVETRQIPNERFFSAAQRRAAQAYQTHCAHPDCRVPAGKCEAHHLDAFVDGGATTIENLALVCRAHHAKNDDTHQAPGRFHYAKDTRGIPYVQYHPERRGEPEPPPQYNELNLQHAPVIRARKTARNALNPSNTGIEADGGDRSGERTQNSPPEAAASPPEAKQ